MGLTPSQSLSLWNFCKWEMKNQLQDKYPEFFEEVRRDCKKGTFWHERTKELYYQILAENMQTSIKTLKTDFSHQAILKISLFLLTSSSQQRAKLFLEIKAHPSRQPEVPVVHADGFQPDRKHD